MSTPGEAHETIEFPRRYLPMEAAFDAWPEIEPFYRELAERTVESAEAFERWMLDFSETDAAFDEEATARHIAMTRATDDAARKQRFLDFIENVQPHREPWHDRLRRRYVELAARFPLPARRYEVLTRSIREGIALFREANIPLQVENARLAQQYQELVGAMTVTFDGEQRTLPQVDRLLEEPDRALRERAWRATSDRFLRDAAQLDELYDQMVRVRDQIARNADCRNFQQYAFRAMERFDYTPQHCFAFHEAVEAVVVPAAQRLAAERRRKLGVTTLRPWDVAVDPDGRAPLRPFNTEAELIAGCSDIFYKVSPALGQVFDTLRQRDALDLSSRRGKAPGGYQACYAERRMPFIFMNAVGAEGDVRTLLHEGGHAFHSWACRQEPLLPYRSAPIEFAEVASMGMECLALPHLDRFYGPDADRARKRFFSEIINILPYIARVDALQHFVYTHPDCGVEARKDEWQKLTRRFAPHIDYTGLEQIERHNWHRKLHFFEAPFYYIEYGIAQLGALQVWLSARSDYDQAVAQYRNGLALGGARPLPELFAAAGLKFDFSEQTIRPLIDAVMQEVERLG